MQTHQIFSTSLDSTKPASINDNSSQGKTSQSENQALFRLTHLKDSDYTQMLWKNGLGKTQEIWIAPPGADFKECNFRWRLSKAYMASSSSFSYFPGYQNSIVLLPPVGKRTSTNSKEIYVKLRHTEECVTHVLRPMTPYTYLGSWATSCEIPYPLYDLTFMARKDSVRGEISVETIEHEVAFRRLCLVSQAIIHVVSGNVLISVEQKGCSLKEGETLIIEKSGNAAPRWIVVESERHGSLSSESVNLVASKVSDMKIPENSSESFLFAAAKIIFIQIHEDFAPDLQPSRKGSIVMDDNEPLLTLLPTLGLKEKYITSTEPIPLEKIPAYKPPPWSIRYQLESVVPAAKLVDKLKIESIPRGTVSSVWVKMMKQGLSDWISVPCIIARGHPMNDGNDDDDDPVVGLTAALHGNEVNGVNCLQRLMADLDVSKLKGTVVAVLCINIPGYLNYKREFSDGRDLNRFFPGRPDGFASQVYCHQIMEKIVTQFTYMLDLHTASFGRENSYYVRADLNQPIEAQMAALQQPQIILHNSGQDGTMRSAAAERGVHAITVEIGNPQQFQAHLIQWTLSGIFNVLNSLGMYEAPVRSLPFDEPTSPVVCSKGFWMYTRTGGVLETYPEVNTFVTKGQLIARVMNIFGNTVDEYESPCDAMVIGKSSNPVATAGDRIVHLGIPMRLREVLPAISKENY